ncbi:baculoviral IAP repeat-containing protein 8-like [Acanthaster planci]|uniref:Baculoviral IAP repeat-containing protein 8-like n=1 Tax=Acanthaster planci TaxID=133434 RepID=A0A8B7ZZR5_ACAPL|nr:baculoviral IAP repeat-containing protein 8-like [Acanthaster planci]XP_022109077.1 baculoviral IAP repeat-containing protein 8-like [Acanthaster planci]
MAIPMEDGHSPQPGSGYTLSEAGKPITQATSDATGANADGLTTQLLNAGTIMEYRALKYKMMCKVCLRPDCIARVVFAPCGHMVMCKQCASTHLMASSVCPQSGCGQHIHYYIIATYHDGRMRFSN